jgi:putative FmdB family regulatory protein
MPIYDFRCLDCGAVTEFILPGISATMDSACPACGSRNLEKLISAPGLLRNYTATSGKTCCGRDEQCESPACSTGNGCRRY